MKSQPSELLAEAIMSRTPYILVEGKNDTQIYDKVASALGKRVEVLPVEFLDGYDEGSFYVVRAIAEIDGMRSNAVLPEKYIIGIIDKDSRDFRNDLPSYPCLLSLEQYSVENYFVSREVIAPAIGVFTGIPVSKLDETVIGFIFNKFEGKISDIFLLSLEALKGAVDDAYLPAVSYSDNAPHKNPNNIVDVRKKEEELEKFRISLNLETTLVNAKRVVKGKWLLALFCEFLKFEINNLHVACRDNLIPSCRFCAEGIIGKCYYKTIPAVTENQIHRQISGFVTHRDFQHVRDKIATLV